VEAAGCRYGRKWDAMGNGRPFLGVVAGAVAGLIGSWATNRFHNLRRGLMPGMQWGEGQSYVGVPGRSSGLGEQLSQEAPFQMENAAVVLAAKIAGPLLGRPLSGQERELGGAVLHYAFGAGTGAVYGALVERAPRVTMGRGLPFGATVWLIADEGAMPALGVTPPRTKLPRAAHISSLAGHLVYGLTVEFTRRAIWRLTTPRL
jgi:putative membrane protein